MDSSFSLGDQPFRERGLRRVPDAGRRTPARGVLSSGHQPTVVFLTVCTHHRTRWLARTSVHRTCREIWESQAAGWRVGDYVLMPDHLHLFCTPGADPEPIPLERWVTYWKRTLARTCSGPGMTRCFQPQHWDTRVRNPEAYRAKRDYVRQNPVRAGLVAKPQDWPFAGAVDDLAWD